MRILFAGTPHIAVPALELLNQMFEVCAVLTSPDKPSGRGRKIVASPVKECAAALAIPVLQPLSLGRAARELISSYKPDFLAVVAYSRIFGPKFLSLFPAGAVNLHPSLLPKHRGPAPIPSAILSGDDTTGITVQRVGLEMDSGDILLQREIKILTGETTGELTERISPIGAEMLIETLQGLESGSIIGTVQDHEAATYCSLISKSDGLVDWQRGAGEIERQVRAYHPWPVAFTYWAGSKLSILRASEIPELDDGPTETSSGTVIGVDKARGILIKTNHRILAVTELQLQARKALGWKAFVNGSPDFVGSMLGGD